MKVVINRCWGGFGLSALAIKEYLKRKGKECYFYKQVGYSFKRKDEKNLYKKVDGSEATGIFVYTSTKDYGDKTNKIENYDYFLDFAVERSDTDLIAIIEEFGEKECSGNHANLHIVNIPDDIEYEIIDSDGMESIEEKHRSWC